MRCFRNIFRKKDAVIFIISIILAVIYTTNSYRPDILFNISNATFIIGIFHAAIGGCIYINNVGLFKTFTYRAYKRKFKQTGSADPTSRPLSFADYAVLLSTNKSSIKEYLVIGLPFLAISYVLAFI